MELRNDQRERNHFHWRLVTALGIVLLAMCVLLGRFFYLQVIQHELYQTRAEDNRIKPMPIPPSRGIITDRNGVELARNYSAYTLEITPSKVSNLDKAIDDLASVVEITPKDRRRFKKLLDESKNFESLPIKNRLTDEEVAKFAAQSFRFPGIEVKARLFRQYPGGESASHLIGYIGRINDADKKRIDEDETLKDNYKGTDHIGKFGIELQYEEALHGKTGFEMVEVDVGNRAVRSLRKVKAVSGNKLVLTIDAKLQQLAEAAFGDHRGALVAIDPSNGDVLALVSRPGFDPNLFVDGIDPISWRELNDSADRPLNNRAIQGTYAPGSTFKPFMALAALETGKRTAQFGFNDPGFFVFANHTWRDDKKGGHGWVDMKTSIVHSCDTYYYQLAMDMGIDNIARFMAPFGFGQKSGVDLPGEKKGVLPSPEWKAKAFRDPRQKKWFGGDTPNIGIGQGFNTYTPIQLAQAMAILSNNGLIFRPHLVKYIEDAASGKRNYVAPQPVGKIELKQSNVDFIKDSMVGVNVAGTGARAFANAGYVSGGKTGTAQVFSLKGEKYNASKVAAHLKDNAWFIAFAPADKPKIALALIVENVGFGAEFAAPIARRVLDYWMLGKLPAEPAPIETPANPYDASDPDTATPHPEQDQ
ncbi:penicillin-binding protein 2 [Burkholderiaceae bacterium DAT-1]|nr:penicillin-binding protein 2 [Burkholderiaceae bacterium DAT-1]